MQHAIALRKRPLDIVLLIYFIFNLVAISYVFDIEQIIINNTASFTYPAWPPHATPHLAAVVGANASWIIAPILIIWRMRKDPFPAA